MVDIEMPGAGTFCLADAETRALVEILWGVSAMPGAVVAIGRLNHSLSHSPQPSLIRLTENEADAVRTGLRTAEQLPEGLSDCLRAFDSLQY